MKNLRILFAVILIGIGTTGFAKPEINDPMTHDPTANQVELRVRVLNNRVEEIKSIDLRGLSSHERKELKEELKSIKKELKGLDGGIYISAGALIVIILILIILL